MSHKSVPPCLFHSIFPEEEMLSRLATVGEELEDVFRFMNLALHVGKIGPWESFGEHEVYLAPSWLLCFGIREEDITVAAEYYDLIDDPAERQRVQEGREKLLRQPVSCFWQDEFTICGQRVRSSAMVTREKTLVGVDVVMD